MRPFSPTLAALALAAGTAVPAFSAVSIKDGDDLTLNVGMDVQPRFEYATSHDANGNHYDIIQGRDGRSDEDFSLRRARLLLSGDYDKVWKFYLGYLVDNGDSLGNNNARGANLFKAWGERLFTMDDGLVHTLHLGLDYPFFNKAIQGDPEWLFPNQRATGDLMNVRGVGARYMFSGSWWDFGIDAQNNQDTAKPAGAADQTEGLFYSTRLEVIAFNDQDRKPGYKETFAGAAGHSLRLSADLGEDNRDYGSSTAGNPVRFNKLCYGFEGIYHLAGLTALAEARFVKTDSTVDNTGATSDLKSRVYLLQAGYCFPVGSIRMEPALRYERINLDTSADETVNYDGTTATGGGTLPALPGITAQNKESGYSGNEWDIGVNFYFNRINRIQLAYSKWKAEEGSADANIYRIQYQIAF